MSTTRNSQVLLRAISNAQQSIPSPFRKFEMAPRLLTRQGVLCPAAVLWINRESFMAAALFVDLESMSSACASDCAEALGLGQFIGLESGKAKLWSLIQPERPCAGKPLFSALHDDLESETTGRRLLDELKPLAVFASRNPEELPGTYFANLLWSSLEDLIIPLEQQHRSARGEGRSSEFSAEDEARHKARISLLRLLALASCDLLPESVQPERLERALDFVLDQLPSPLPLLHCFSEEELPLPPQCAVRLHLLFRRLSQLQWVQVPGCGADALRLLLEAQVFGGWAMELPAGWNQASLHLHNQPQTTLKAQSLRESSDQPALLAAKALFRQLQHEGETIQPQIEYVRNLSTAPPAECYLLSLDRTAPPEPQSRGILATALKKSWPGRRIPLGSSAPYWLYELICVSGQAPPGARLAVRIPSHQLSALLSPELLPLFCIDLGLKEINQIDNEAIALTFTKGEIAENLCLRSAQGVCSLPIDQKAFHQLSLKAQLGLNMGRELLEALDSGELQAISAPLDLLSLRACHLFLRTSLGQYMWRALKGERPLPSFRGLTALLSREALLVPLPALLNEFAALDWREGQPPPSASRLNRLLPPALLNLGYTKQSVPLQTAPVRSGIELEYIAQDVFADGVPRFPEQYLFDHYLPELIHYSFTPPLILKGEFFGTFSLRDARQQCLEVSGVDRARALILTAACGRNEVDLPTDPLLCANIVERYESDLSALQKKLLIRTHALLSSPAQADRTAREIWSQHSLPDWNDLQ